MRDLIILWGRALLVLAAWALLAGAVLEMESPPPSCNASRCA